MSKVSRKNEFFGGLDPSGGANKPSGCALLDANGVLLKAEHATMDNYILDFFDGYDCGAIGVDAPIGLPIGMHLCCLQERPLCACEVTRSRECERALIREGVSVYPVNKNTFTSAKRWIARGLVLFMRLQNMGFPCYEVFPTGTKNRFFPDTEFARPKTLRASRKTLQQRLKAHIKGMADPEESLYSDHILDAILSAFTVYQYYRHQNGELVGDPREGQILIPTRPLE